MKKGMLGVLVMGIIVIMILTAAVPSSTIQGTLFPSKVMIHTDTDIKGIDLITGDNGVINFNDKAYIPLRLFAEEMGASVEYAPPSFASHGLHEISIYQNVAPIAWSLERTDLTFPPDTCGTYQFPFYIIPTSVRNTDGTTDYNKFHFKVHNLMKDDISVEPIELVFEVRAEGGPVVYRRYLPPVSGVIPSQFGFNADVSWEHIGMDGKEVPPGNYFITLNRPNVISYKVLGSVEEKSANIESGMGCNLEYFRITLDEKSAKAKLTDKEAKEILKLLIPNALSFYGMFNGTGWFEVDKTQTIPDEPRYAKVIDDKITSLADLKNAVEQVMTHEIAQTVFFSRYLEPDTKDHPLFKDYEGKLYNDTQNGGHGWAFEFLTNTAKVISQQDNVVEVELERTLFNKPDVKLIVRMELVNGKWILASRLDI